MYNHQFKVESEDCFLYIYIYSYSAVSSSVLGFFLVLVFALSVCNFL